MVENIYKKLEIKDYDNVFEFIDDVADRNTLSDVNDAVIILGNGDFIHECVIQLADLYEYRICSVNLYDSVIEGTYMLEVYFDRKMRRTVMDATPIGMYGNKTWVEKALPMYDYTRVFLNQDCVQQDTVDFCLKNCDEIMLFGINEEDDAKCGGDCPWCDECELHLCE